MRVPLPLDCVMQSQFDYIFLFNDDFMANKKRMYEYYGGIFPDFSSFKAVWEHLYHCGSKIVYISIIHKN